MSGKLQFVVHEFVAQQTGIATKTPRHEGSQRELRVPLCLCDFVARRMLISDSVPELSIACDFKARQTEVYRTFFTALSRY